ncbi:hypothetical protein EV202_101263 [Bacteroides heparinolyticus]|uniref:Uncharacterized protein n=1 Tax=Prevotella heparinolytica TaxID=28113 RepID=A0A4R2LR48_9BACE|nr:hypothetical protein EV202_101263 [Bacteroides heparinolyticus]
MQSCSSYLPLIHVLMCLFGSKQYFEKFPLCWQTLIFQVYYFIFLLTPLIIHNFLVVLFLIIMANIVCVLLVSNIMGKNTIDFTG